MRSSSLTLLRPWLLIAVAACASPGETRATEDLPAPRTDLRATAGKAPQTLVLAGGCFWCTEGVFERLAGVTEVVSGYAGGTAESATYEQVSNGSTGHAESVRITYDPSHISFGKLLQVYFTVIDPTTRDRQGPDAGHQYRSAIFYQNEEQRSVAAAYIQQLEAAKVFHKPIATTLESLTVFYPAEAYHQDYVRRHPDHPYIQMWFPAKLQKLKDHFKGQLKPGADKLD